MKPMTCAEAMQQLFAYLDRALSGDSIEGLESHFQECLECCDRLEFSRQLDRFVKTRLKEAPLPPGLEDRIRKALGRD